MARGSGTSLSGGAVPIEDGIVIALNRMNRVLRFDPAARIAVVEPGVVNLAVTAMAAPHGLYYAPDPSSQSVCTIGGNVAFNSGGAHCFRHGMTANHVLGLRVVLGDGTVATLGGDSLEQAGADLAGLFVGSEGLFGIALEITLRLVARPAVYRTVLAAYASLQAAGDAVSRVIESGLLPGAMEIMDRLAMDAAEAAVQAGYPTGAAAVLIVECEGEDAQVAAEFERADGDHRGLRGGAHARRGRRGGTGADLEGPQVRVLGGGTAQPGLHRPGRRRAACPARRGARDDRSDVARARHPRGQRVPRRRRQPAPADPLRRPRGRRTRSRRGPGRGDPAPVHPPGRIDHRRARRRAREAAFLGEMYSEADLDCMRRMRVAMDPHGVAKPGKKLAAPAAARGISHGLHPLERAGVISRA